MNSFRKIILVLLLLSISLVHAKEHIAYRYTATLHPKDTVFFSRAGNVIQGIASHKQYWITTQHHRNRVLLFNVLNSKGHSVYRQRIRYASHGQDLGIKQLDDHHLLLLTRGNRKGTVGLFVLTYGRSLSQTYSIRPLTTVSLPVGHHKVTPTLSTDGKTLLLHSGGYIYLFVAGSVGKAPGKFTKIGKFPLSKAQRKKTKWFQGIAMHKGRIYCLVADNSLKHKKSLYVYNTKGKVLQHYTLSMGYRYARTHGVKWEMEGLAFHGDDLYTVVISGFNGRNTKQLYRILTTAHKDSKK